jgi:hypothetical protein
MPDYEKAFAMFERALNAVTPELSSEELTKLRHIITERSPIWLAVRDSLLALSYELETPVKDKEPEPETDGLFRTLNPKSKVN